MMSSELTFRKNSVLQSKRNVSLLATAQYRGSVPVTFDIYSLFIQLLSFRLIDLISITLSNVIIFKHEAHKRLRCCFTHFFIKIMLSTFKICTTRIRNSLKNRIEEQQIYATVVKTSGLERMVVNTITCYIYGWVMEWSLDK